MRKSWTTWIALGGAILFPSFAPAIHTGQSLVEALEELRRSGLNVIYSTALLPADLRVTHDPGEGPAVERARSLLAAHELDLVHVSDGHFVVVRRSEPAHDARFAHRQSASQAESRLTPDTPAVTVYASRYEVIQQPTQTSARIESEDLDALPGLTQDALGAVRHLPGTTSAGLSARTHVRGGRENEVSMYFDGVPLLMPFHLRDFPAPLSMLDPGVISGLELFSGVLPARYGNALSGVIDVKPRRWQGSSHHEVGASTLYAHGLSQGRLDVLPLEWLFVARRSTNGRASDVADSNLGRPEFQDVLTRIQLDLSERTELTAGWLALKDNLPLSQSSAPGGWASASYRDDTYWLALRQQWGPGTVLAVTAARTQWDNFRDGSVNPPGNASSMVGEQDRFTAASLRAEATTMLSPNLGSTFGIEVAEYAASFGGTRSTRYEPHLAAALGRADEELRFFWASQEGDTYALHGSLHFKPDDRWAADLGLRWDVQSFSGGDGSQLTPRLSAEYRLSSRTTLRAGLGAHAQAGRPQDLYFADGETQAHRAERSWQAVISMQHRWSDTLDLRVEGYTKRVRDPAPYYENLFDPVSLAPEVDVDRVRVDPQKALMHGAEISVRWLSAGPWSAWFQYARSTAQDEIDGRNVPRSWSADHAAKAGVSWARDRWRLSAANSWHSGWPTTRISVSSTDPGTLTLGQRNADELPDWFHLDLRASYAWPLRRGALRLFTEVINVTGSNTICCTELEVVGQANTLALNQYPHDRMPRRIFGGVTWELQ
jgi:hypothetical protein